MKRNSIWHKVVFALAAITTLALAALSAQAQDKLTIKLGWATSDASQDSFAIAAHAFKARLEEAAGERFEVELYPNRQIGDEKQLVEGLRLGTVTAAVISNGVYSQVVPAFQLNDLPFFYARERQVFDLMDGEIGAELSSRLDDKGIVMLAYLANGYRHMLNNKAPVFAPSDVVGVKYRVHNNVALATYQALGASPVPMAWGETTTALQQGAVDGLDLPVGVMDSLKINESVKYLSLTGHTYSGAALSMSKRFFNKLTEEQRQAIKSAATAAAAEQRATNAANEQAILETLATKGLMINEVADKTAFRAMVLPLYEELREDIGSDILDSAMAKAD